MQQTSTGREGRASMAVEITRKARRVLMGAAAVALVVGGLSSRAQAVNQYFFNWDNANVGNGTNFADTPLLSDDPATNADTQARLATQRSLGKPLAVRVLTPISATGPASQTLKIYPIQYIFADYEGPNAVTQTQNVVNTVVNTGGLSRNAFVGNFNYYPGMQSDPTRSTSVPDEYTASHANMANPELYPGAPDFRNPANGNSTAPNIRSALFTLPIERLTVATNELYGRGASLSQTQNGSATDASFAGGFKSAPNIPWVTRFNNFGNTALSNAPALPDGERPFVQTAANPAAGQLPSRGDFMAQILQYRLRGADSVNLFQASLFDRFGNPYTDTQQQLDVNQGWFVTGQPGNVGNTVNGIFATHHYGFANLSNLVSLDTNRPGGAPLRTNFEALGVAYSGVYTRGSGQHQRDHRCRRLPRQIRRVPPGRPRQPVGPHHQ